MGKSIQLSLCVLIVISVLWKPVYSDQCSLACKGSPKTPTFLNGHKYSYGVEGSVSVYLSGQDKQETSVKLLGQATVIALGNCVNELQVQNLVISGPDGKKFGSPPGLEKPIRFTLEDGRVGPQICTEDGDTRRSVNIKRAIVSLLQTENKPSTQVDIFGSCPTEATSSQEGPSMLVHRTRDLSRCAHREQGKNALITAVYNPSAEIKSTQVLQSILNVESKVTTGVPEKVSATEEYVYRPFSVGENGARARVHTKLTLTGKAGGAASTSKCDHPRTIIFENPHNSAHTGTPDFAMKAVKATAAAVQKEAGSKSAGIFAELVRALRTVKKDDLVAVFNQVKGNQLERRVFLDGLLRAGTGDSIGASIELALSKNLSILEQQLVFLSFGNARHVNSESIQAAVSLLEQPILAKEIYLGIGALAGAFCREHQCHNTKNEAITALSQKFAAKINCRPKSKFDEDIVVAVLKGVRNIRHLEDNLVDKVMRCAADHNAKARVRVAALEAFAADPCDPKLKKAAIEIMKNRNLDSEIRIKGYLAVIECPCAGSANEIKNLLKTEPVHQVGRFISTSLRHIRSSSNPDNYLARQHYGQIGIPCNFNVDDRKYSFYREMSFNADALGLGGTAEQTVIYSQDSFLPRSASLNLTAEVFGHSLNVLEIGGRQGNLDRVIEHFLGPKSFLRTQKPQDIYDNIVKKFQETEKKVEDRLSRGRRSVKSEVDNFDKHLKTESEPFNNQLELDLYVKLFGTDAVFLSFGDDKGFDFNTYLERFLKSVNSGINDIKRFQQDLRANLLFLDAELAYPTSTGLPLKLDLVGAATGRFEVATNIDLRQIYRNPKNAKIDFKLVPSTNVEIAGTFIVDAYSVATGIKVVTNLHSSTGGHLIAKMIEDGNGIDIQFGLPIDKQEIISASNDVLIFTSVQGEQEKNVPVKLTTDRKEYAACFDQLAGVLGLTLCADASVPFSVSGSDAQASVAKFVAHLPLTRAAVKVTLEKNDLRGYHLKGIFRNDYPRRQAFELLFEAEGSKNRRTSLSGELINTEEEKSAKLSFESPIKTAHALAAYYNKPTGRLVEIKGVIDKEEYYAKAGFEVQGGGNRRVYKPLLEYKMPPGDKQSVKIDGQLIEEINEPVRKYTLEGLKIHIPSSQEVIDVNGHFLQEPRKIDLDIKAKKGEHSLSLSATISDRVKAEFQNTLNPYVNFKLDGRFENTEGNYHNDLELSYGPDFRDKKNRVSFQQLLKYHKKSSVDFDVITKNKIEIYSLPFKIEVNADVDPKKVDAKLEGVYMDRSAEFKVDGRSQIKKPGDYSVKFYGEVDKKGVEVFSKRDIISADKSNFENYISLKNIGKYELSGVVMHKTKPNDLNVGAIGHLKFVGSAKTEEFKFDIGAVENPGLYSSRAKISSTKGEILDYLLKIQRGANANGELKFVLKDAISAMGQYKVTDNNGQGNGMIIIDFKKSQQKIKGDVKFTAKSPVFNMDLDLFLNFEKNNNDKIHYSTVTKCTEKLVDTKNKLEYSGKQVLEFNFHRDAPSLTKSQTEMEVILPTERQLSLKVEQDIEKKDDTINGHVNVILSDATKRGGPASTIAIKSKVTNTNPEKENFDVEGEVDIKLKDGRDLQNTFVLKNVPGAKNKFDFKTDVKGSLIPKPASLMASEESVESSHLESKYRVKGQYGDDMGFELEGNLYNSDIWDRSTFSSVVFCPQCCSNVFSFEPSIGKGKPYKYQEDSKLTIRLPFEKAHDIKISSNVLLVRPEYDGDLSIEFTVMESLQINADLYKFEGNGKFGAKNDFDISTFNGKTKVLVPHNDPFALELSFNTDTTGEKEHITMNTVAQYGKGKKAEVKLTGEGGPGFFQVEVVGNAPQAEKLKKLEFKAKSSVQNERYSGMANLKLDSAEYKVDMKSVTSKVNPELDFSFSCPHMAAPSRIFFKGSGLSSSEGTVDFDIENIKDISISGKTHAKILRDNVEMKMVANSEKLNMKNYIIEITSKDAGGSKRLEFHATNDGKNVFSGSTSFISKQEGQKSIIEGSGSVKVRDEQKSANFKYIRTMLTEGNEQGIETFLDLTIGERSYVAESRVTNLEYKNSYVYCEEKKQCANVEILSRIALPQHDSIKHLFNVIFDLRKLGFAPEFGLQVTSEVSGKKFPQYSLDLHVNKEDKKYYLHVYSQPEHGKIPAGVTVTLPHRVLALESVVTYPADKAMPFPIKGEVALHLDKNKPQLKTAAYFVIDATGSETQHSFQGEIGFTHPKFQGKKAVMKFGESFTRVAENSIKFESLYHVELLTGESRDVKFFLEADPIHIKLLLETPVAKLIDLEGSVPIKDNQLQADLKFNLLQGHPVEAHAIIKDYKYFEFTTGYSDQAENRLSVIGHIDPEKRIDISADIILAKEKKNIAHGAIFLQDNLIKSDYGASKENYQYFLRAVEKDILQLEARIKELGEKSSQELKTTFDRQVAMAKEAGESLNQELQKLIKEVSDDQALNDIMKAFNEIAQFLAKIIDDVVQGTRPIIETIEKTMETMYKTISEDLYKKKLEPQLKQLYASIAAIVREYFEGLLELVSHFAALVSDFIEKHKPELQELTNTMTEIFKDVTRLLVAQLKEIRDRLADIIQSIIQDIKEMPILAVLKEKYQELEVPEQALTILREVHGFIRGLMPTEELAQFSDALYGYIEMKLKQQKIDDSAHLRIIYEKLVVAVTSMVQFVRQQASQYGVPSYANFNLASLLSGPSQAPTTFFGGIPTFSLLTQILNGDFMNPIALIQAYRPRSLNPLDEVPAKLRAVVVNGQHIFTFDGRHLTFPGTCRYVLAHDAVDKNFTLVIQLQAGQPKAIILQEKSGKSVELKANGQAAFNGAAHPYPVIEDDIFAFRDPYGRIGMGTEYGAMVFCSSKLEVCYIEVNGFYLGKLRGILGDGNNEPYDDFRMPNGKITKSESEFGHSYRLSSSCPAVETPSHSHDQLSGPLPAACEEVFGVTSPLKYVGLLMNNAPFRQACAHLAHSADAKKEACDLARGYTALAVSTMIPAFVPPECMQCTDGDTPRKIGESFEVKLPNKKADIVVSVEVTKPTEKNYVDLVVPLVSQIVDTLKSKHITDIKVFLVGISPKMPYPIIYDTDVKLKSPKVKFDDTSRYINTPLVNTGNEKFDAYEESVVSALDMIRVRLGLTNVVAGYHSLLELPLRPGAVKHTINVVGEHCVNLFPGVELVRDISFSLLFRNLGYSNTLVTVTPNLKIGGGKDPKQIVGFTEDIVLFLGDKKPTKESEALVKTLDVEDDGCIDFITSTDGLILSATNYHSLNPGEQKQFLQTASSAIVGRLLGTSVEQQCTCHYKDPFTARSHCVTTKELPAQGRRK